jgi:hypothetical protein
MFPKIGAHKTKLSLEDLAEASRLRDDLFSGTDFGDEVQKPDPAVNETSLDGIEKPDPADDETSLGEKDLPPEESFDQDLVLELAEKISSNFKSNPAVARIGFRNMISKVNGGEVEADEKEAVEQIEGDASDTSLLAVIGGIQGILGSNLEDERKLEISEKILEHFSFVGDGNERDEFAASQKLIESWAALYEDKDLNITEEEKLVFGECFRSAILGDEKQNPLEDPQLEESREEDLTSPTAPKNKKKPTETSTDQEAESPKSEEKKDKSPKKNMSLEDLAGFAKSSITPMMRVGAAFAIAFLVPGVGPILALAFLIGTSPDLEKKKSSEELSDKEESEAEKYLKEKQKIADANSKSPKDNDQKVLVVSDDSKAIDEDLPQKQSEAAKTQDALQKSDEKDATVEAGNAKTPLLESVDEVTKVLKQNSVRGGGEDGVPDESPSKQAARNPSNSRGV